MDMPWTKNLVKKLRPEGLRRHTSLGTLTKGEMDKERPIAITHWRLPIAYTGASYSHTLKRYGCASPIEWVQDPKTTLPSGLNISSNGQVSGIVNAEPGVYKIILKSSGTSCDPVSTTYYLPVKNLLPAAEIKITDPGLWYEYRTPHFDTDPGLDSIPSIATGSTPTFSFSVAKDEKYAIRFSGYLDVPADGSYSFQVGTENQSRLYIDDQLVVDHWMRDNRARIAWGDFDSELGLKSGKHKIVLTVNNGNYDRYNLYGEFPSMHNMFEVRWKIPGTTSHVPILESALFNPGIFYRLPSNDSRYHALNPTDCRRVEQDLRARQRQQTGGFRKPLIPTDKYADFADTGINRPETCVSRGEIILFVIAGIIRNVHFTIAARQAAITIENYCSIVVKASSSSFKYRANNDHLQSMCQH